jgi:hypothetical protein
MYKELNFISYIQSILIITLARVLLQFFNIKGFFIGFNRGIRGSRRVLESIIEVIIILEASKAL